MSAERTEPLFRGAAVGRRKDWAAAMLLKTKGLVLKARPIGENDKILRVLTAEMGMIEVAARRAKSTKSPLTAASQLMTYSEFCLYKGKQSYYIVDAAELLHPFYELRRDVEKLALAGYFCELADTLSPSAETAPEFLRFLLNTLSLLEEGRLPNEQLKAIFELRTLSLGGFLPNLVACAECGQFEREPMYFLPLEGVLVCGDCLAGSPYDSPDVIRALLPPPVLSAMRHIVYSEPDRVFSFRLVGDSLARLCRVAENYMRLHVEGKFKSLDIYKQFL